MKSSIIPQVKSFETNVNSLTNSVKIYSNILTAAILLSIVVCFIKISKIFSEIKKIESEISSESKRLEDEIKLTEDKRKRIENEIKEWKTEEASAISAFNDVISDRKNFHSIEQPILGDLEQSVEDEKEILQEKKNYLDKCLEKQKLENEINDLKSKIQKEKIPTKEEDRSIDGKQEDKVQEAKKLNINEKLDKLTVEKQRLDYEKDRLLVEEAEKRETQKLLKSIEDRRIRAEAEAAENLKKEIEDQKLEIDELAKANNCNPEDIIMLQKEEYATLYKNDVVHRGGFFPRVLKKSPRGHLYLNPTNKLSHEAYAKLVALMSGEFNKSNFYNYNNIECIYPDNPLFESAKLRGCYIDKVNIVVISFYDLNKIITDVSDRIRRGTTFWHEVSVETFEQFKKNIDLAKKEFIETSMNSKDKKDGLSEFDRYTDVAQVGNKKYIALEKGSIADKCMNKTINERKWLEKDLSWTELLKKAFDK